MKNLEDKIVVIAKGAGPLDNMQEFQQLLSIRSANEPKEMIRFIKSTSENLNI